MEPNLLDKMLTTYCDACTPVTVVLQSKSQVSGTIRAFDSYVIVMENRNHDIIYRHAISCVSPRIAEQPRIAAPRKTESARSVPKPAGYPQKAARAKKQTPAPRIAAASAAPEAGLSNTMKDGLLKWMQEHKATK